MALVETPTWQEYHPCPLHDQLALLVPQHPRSLVYKHCPLKANLKSCMFSFKYPTDLGICWYHFLLINLLLEFRQIISNPIGPWILFVFPTAKSVIITVAFKNSFQHHKRAIWRPEPSQHLGKFLILERFQTMIPFICTELGHKFWDNMKSHVSSSSSALKKGWSLTTHNSTIVSVSNKGNVLLKYRYESHKRRLGMIFRTWCLNKGMKH